MFIENIFLLGCRMHRIKKKVMTELVQTSRGHILHDAIGAVVFIERVIRIKAKSRGTWSRCRNRFADPRQRGYADPSLRTPGTDDRRVENRCATSDGTRSIVFARAGSRGIYAPTGDRERFPRPRASRRQRSLAISRPVTASIPAATERTPSHTTHAQCRRFGRTPRRARFIRGNFCRRDGNGRELFRS